MVPPTPSLGGCAPLPPPAPPPMPPSLKFGIVYDICPFVSVLLWRISSECEARDLDF